MFPGNINQSHQPNASTDVSVTVSSRATVTVVVESCIFLLLNIATLVGNSLVCLAFYRNPSLRTSTNYFMLSPALTDLCIAFLVMPWRTALNIAANKVANELNCELYYFCASGFAGVSLLTVMLLAVNRYFRVAQTTLYPGIFSKKRSLALVICAWVVTLALVTVVGFATRKQPQIFTAIESVA